MGLAAVIAAVVKMESIRMEFVCRTVLSIFMSKGHDSCQSGSVCLVGRAELYPTYASPIA